MLELSSLQSLIIVSSLCVSALFLILDVIFLALAKRSFQKSKSEDKLVKAYLSTLLTSSIVKFLSILLFIPIIHHLTKKNSDILKSIRVATSIPFISLNDEQPWLMGILIADYMIYFASASVSLIITSALMRRLESEKLEETLSYIKFVKRIDSTSFSLYLVFGLVTGIFALWNAMRSISSP